MMGNTQEEKSIKENKGRNEKGTKYTAVASRDVYTFNYCYSH
jgi:hypothetical protein